MNNLERVRALSQPIPCDPSRGHHLRIASWKVLDGGVVEWRYQAMCRCYWSQQFPSATEREATRRYEAHL